ncbi:MAG: hypothetical protein ACRC26_11265, partial [Bacteroidales bacterium]
HQLSLEKKSIPVNLHFQLPYCNKQNKCDYHTIYKQLTIWQLVWQLIELPYRNTNFIIISPHQTTIHSSK